jgi:hypothetical protein
MLGAGLCALRLAIRSSSSWSFESSITQLAMFGGDADTNCAFAGALLGAYGGYEKLPPTWRDGLRHGAWLKSKCEQACIDFGLVEGQYDGKGDVENAVDAGKGLLTPDQVSAASRKEGRC